jgi:hemerythrin
MLNYPQVPLDFMNRDHAEFVALRAGLLAQLDAQSPEAALDGLLDELLEHTRHHFAEEERQMQETRFPPFTLHKGEHDAVLADMAAKINQWKQGRKWNDLRAWLEGAVGDWFVNHVTTMDFVTAGFIAARRGERT